MTFPNLFFILLSLLGEFLQLFPSVNFFLAIKILSRWRLGDLPRVGEEVMKDELPLRCPGSIERFVKVMEVPFLQEEERY